MATLIHLHGLIMTIDIELSYISHSQYDGIDQTEGFSLKLKPPPIFWHWTKHSPLPSNLILTVGVFSGKKASGLGPLLGK